MSNHEVTDAIPKMNTPNTVKPAFTYFDQLDTILKQRGKEPELSIKSLSDLNKKLWGFKKGQLYVVGAYTSHAKTSFCLQLARDWAEQDFSVMYLSLEIPVTRCLERLLCQKYQIPNVSLFTGHRDQHLDSIKSFENDLKKWRLVITDCIGDSWQDVDTLVSKLNTKPDVIILDYAQMTKRKARIQKDDFDEYIKHFREMAIRYNFCGIIVSQTGRASRESDNKDPQLHHLSGSSIFETHADVVVLLKWNYRDTNDQKDFNKYTVYISKNNDGATGYCELYFKPENYLFFDLQEEETQKSWTEKEENRDFYAKIGFRVTQKGTIVRKGDNQQVPKMSKEKT